MPRVSTLAELNAALDKLRPLDIERPCCDAGYAYETWRRQVDAHDRGECPCERHIERGYN